MNDQPQKITLRDRKKAQPKAKLYFSEPEKATIITTVAKGLDDSQVKIFFYTCQALGLNPLLNEIAAVPYHDRSTGKKDLSIQVMRDGFLTIAHRSGKFAGLESGVYEKGQTTPDGRTVNDLVGWAKVYHKDFKVPVYQEADFGEYSILERGGKPTLWKSKPKTMIKKVAESMALRKAFNVSGVYAPEEMEKEIAVATQTKELPQLVDGNKPATEAQLQTIASLVPEFEPERSTLTKQEAAEKIKELSQKK